MKCISQNIKSPCLIHKFLDYDSSVFCTIEKKETLIYIQHNTVEVQEEGLCEAFT